MDKGIIGGGVLGRCADAEELWRWVKEFRGMEIPRQAVCAGHDAPFEYLRGAYFEPATDVVVWAPRGGGKTRLGALATLLDLLHKPGISVRILGGSLEQSLRMWEHLAADWEEIGERLKGKLGARRLTLEGGSVAAVVTQSQRSVRGLRVQKLRCDEVELFDPAVWEAAQLVTRSKKVEGVEVAGTIEALSTFHESCGMMEKVVDRAGAEKIRVVKWCLLEVLEKCPPERECASCPLFEECAGVAKERCAGFVTVDDAINMKRRVSRETWETEMLCRRPVTRGQVFPSYDAALHVGEGWELPGRGAQREDLEGLDLGIDFGFANPFVCLWIRQDRWGRVQVIDEYVEAKKVMDQHIKEIQKRGHGIIRRIGCDPAGSARNEQTGMSNVQRLRREGWTVRFKGSRIPEGLEMIRAALFNGTGEVKLKIHSRCRRLIEAMRGYHYKPGGGEVPLKDNVHDHLIDALRYWFVNAESGSPMGGWY